MTFKKNLYFSTLFTWIPLAFVITFLSGLIYVVVQQNYRQSANDLQIQLAEDLGNELADGANPQQITGTHKTQINKSLEPFVIIYDDSGKEIAASAELGGKTPTLPAGVFDAVKTSGEKRFTWQPRRDVRSAVVIMKYSGKNSGFILAGKSLREVEKRVDRLGMIVVLAWAGSLFASLFLVWILSLLKNQLKL